MSAETIRAVQNSPVVAALQKASAATGTGFDYLLKTAMRESGLKADAKATTSSASGLFQFVEQTWMGLVKDYGGKYGLSSYAGAIAKGGDGRYHAASSADRQAILDLRSDPQVSALMAGEYANQCKTRMQSSLGRPVGEGELYAAHFLGPDTACKLIRLNEAAPGASAAEAFPQAAEANRSVFYRADGSSKSVSEVYAWATHQGGGSVAYAAAQTPTRTVSPQSYAVALSQFETRMLASALLSEPASGASGSPGQETGQGQTGLPTSSSGGGPLQLSYGMLDVLSSLGVPATKNQT